MAQTGYDRPQAGSHEPAETVTAERARQAQNIKGMILVSLISLGPVVAAFVVMLALQQQPVAPDTRPAT